MKLIVLLFTFAIGIQTLAFGQSATKDSVPLNEKSAAFQVAYSLECSLTTTNESRIWCTDLGLSEQIRKQYQAPKIKTKLEIADTLKYSLSFILDTIGKVSNVIVFPNLNDTINLAIIEAVKKVPFKPALDNNSSPIFSRWKTTVDAKLFNYYFLNDFCIANPDSCDEKGRKLSELSDIPVMFVSQMPYAKECEGFLTNKKRSECTSKSISAFIIHNYKTPEKAVMQKLEGRVYAKFTVDKSGVVKNVVILRGLTTEVDEEVVRVIEGLPRFVPGYHLGEAKSVLFTIPIDITR